MPRTLRFCNQNSETPDAGALRDPKPDVLDRAGSWGSREEGFFRLDSAGSGVFYSSPNRLAGGIPMANGAGSPSVQSWNKRLAARFPSRAEQLIPALHYVQERAGFLPKEAITAVARHLKLSEAKVFGVASFYSLFHLKPRGRSQITVCRGTACHVRGSARILGELERTLGIQAGGTTPDMLFSLETVACLGSCALAPVVVKDKVYGRQTVTSVKKLVGSGHGAKPGAGRTPGSRRKQPEREG